MTELKKARCDYVWDDRRVKQFYVYILASRSGVLYVGMTNDLEKRVSDDKSKRVPGFTARYSVNRLVFYETFPTAWQAITQEKVVKGWRREKKVRLIESVNPTWRDLSEGWYDAPVCPDVQSTLAERSNAWAAQAQSSRSAARDLGPRTCAGPRSEIPRSNAVETAFHSG